MKETQEIVDLFHELMFKIQNREKRPNNFGTGEILYRFEIHVIDAINRNPGITASDLSKMLLVTKGAISQVISKLVKKGFIAKEKDPASNKMIYLTTTQKGGFIAQKHNEFHKTLINGLIKEFRKENEFNPEMLLKFFKLLSSKL